MEELSIAESRQAASPRLPIAKRTVRRPATLVLCSQVAGRDRWHVDALEESPRLAAAVELVLRSEEGITEVRANPLTGRVLVCYNPALLTESVENLIIRALSCGPMSREEFSILRSRKSASTNLGSLVAAELSCSVFKMIMLGGICPAGLAAAAFFFLLKMVTPAGLCAHAA